jgi:hypothetical protein
VVFREALAATDHQLMVYDEGVWDLHCFRGAFPPVDFRAVCLVRAILLLLVEMDVGRQSSERVSKLMKNRTRRDHPIYICMLSYPLQGMT